MKKEFLTIVLILVAFATSAQSYRFFQGTLQEARDKAKKENKVVMILASATWCGPCKKLTDEIMLDRDVIMYFEDKIVPVKYYLDKEDPENIAKTYKVDSYPTMIFLNGEGKEISRMTGGSPTPENFLNRVIASIDPKNTPQAWKERIEKDPRQTIGYLNYLLTLYQRQKADSVLTKALNELPLSVTFSEEWMKYYRKAVADTSSVVLKIMFERPKEVKQVIGKEEYQKFMGQKSAYFLSRNTINKFYKREIWEQYIKFVEQSPAMRTEYLSFVKHNINDIEKGNFEPVYKQVKKRIKRADYYSRMQMLNTVAFIGIKKNGMKYADPRFIALVDLMIKTQKDPEYRQWHIDVKENLLKRKD